MPRLQQPASFVWTGALALFGGVVLLASGLQIVRRRRRLLGMPASTIRSLAIGPARVRGNFSSSRMRVAPLSGIACPLYGLQIDELVLDGAIRGWRMIAFLGKWEECAIVDETGTVAFDPTEMLVYARPTGTVRTRLIGRTPHATVDRIARCFDRLHADGVVISDAVRSQIDQSQVVRLREYAMQPTDVVDFVGVAASRAAGRRSRQQADRLALTSGDRACILRVNGAPVEPWWKFSYTLGLGTLFTTLGVGLLAYAYQWIRVDTAFVLIVALLLLVFSGFAWSYFRRADRL
jgi:hypothetical protein